MKKDFTLVSVIIDKSGSMYGLVKDTIGGFNKFLEDQKLLPGECKFNTVLFDTSVTTLHEDVPVASIKAMTTEEYRPSGGTALLDAVGKTINKVGEKLNKLAEDQRPEKVVFVIITDGEENASHGFTNSKIKEMIQHQEAKYNWQFLFLGANQDAFSTAANIGITWDKAANYNATNAGTANCYANVSASIGVLRSSSEVKTCGFTKEQQSSMSNTK